MQSIEVQTKLGVLKAIKSESLDFPGIDIVLTQDNRSQVVGSIEVRQFRNTAPSIEMVANKNLKLGAL